MYLSDIERNHFVKILKKYLSGTASPEETEFVELYYNYLQQQPDVVEMLSEQERSHLEEEIKQLLLTSIKKGSVAPPPIHLLPSRKAWWKLPAAAAVFILLTGAVIYSVYLSRSTRPAALGHVEKKQADIPPGGDKALLTLADGTTIVLDSAANGGLAQQGNTAIFKLKSGVLAYKGKALLKEGADISYNTVATPKGGQYQVVLPDGSHVWLNAGSFIRFPVIFGKERAVEIGGEAYFEVAKSKGEPFRVSANGTEIQVLGTSFNINAYKEDIETRTTLIDGSVKIVKGGAAKLLQPGEQARVTSDSRVDVIKDANTEEILAWKNGLFYFNTADIRTFMKQLERWYDIEVRYEGNLPTLKISGKMQRNLNLSQLLKILNGMEVHFKMEGRVLTILP